MYKRYFNKHESVNEIGQNKTYEISEALRPIFDSALAGGFCLRDLCALIILEAQRYTTWYTTRPRPLPHETH